MVIFDLTAQNSGSCGADLWVDLGFILTSYYIWIGYATYVSLDKSLTFELRGNLVGQSAGDAAHTLLYDNAALKAGGTVSHDLYRKGRLNIQTVTGTGVEHWWLHLKSKSGTSGSFLYTIRYTNC